MKITPRNVLAPFPVHLRRPPLCVSSPCTSFSLSHLAPMAATSDGSWVCPECGKVCKSRGGLTKHTSVHRRNIRVGEPHKNLHRIYHPTFDGASNLPSVKTAPNPIPSRNTLPQRWGVPSTRNTIPSPAFETQRRLDSFHFARWVRACRNPIQHSIALKQQHRQTP